MNQKTKNLIKSFLLVAGFSLTVTAMATWFSPTANPLTNVEPPINTSSNAQMKPGVVAFGGIRSMGITLLDGSVQLGGKITIGNGNGRGGSLASDAVSTTTSALLELNSTNQGLLLPRLTQAQRDSIVSPVAGLIIFQTDNGPGIRSYNGRGWDIVNVTPDGTLH